MTKTASVTITLSRNDEPLPDDGSGDSNGDDGSETGSVVVLIQDEEGKGIEHGQVVLSGGGTTRTKQIPTTSGVSFKDVPIQGYSITVQAQGYGTEERLIYAQSFKE